MYWLMLVLLLLKTALSSEILDPALARFRKMVYSPEHRAIELAGIEM